MPDHRQSERNPLTPTEGQRSVSPRSTLASRGLDLALTVQRENKEAVARPQPKPGLAEEEILLPSRTLRFPTDYSMGHLWLRRWNSPIVTWADMGETDADSWLELGEARGEIYIPSGGELWLRLGDEEVDLSPLSTFAPHDVQRIGHQLDFLIREVSFNDEVMECLQNLTGLLELHLWGSDVTDEGLKFLQNLNRLRELSLSNTHVTDEGLIYLQDLQNLEWLGLGDTAVSDAGLASLTHLKNLEGLNLADTHVTDEGLLYLQDLQNLERLGLGDTAVSDAGLASLAHLRNLEYLGLDSTHVTDEGLRYLHGLQNLEQLWLGGTGVSDTGLASIRYALPDCEISHDGKEEYYAL